jgi:HNH/ENDO VII superfamily nuclease
LQVHLTPLLPPLLPHLTPLLPLLPCFFDLLAGNYGGAGKTIAQEVVHGKMGNLARVAKMSPRAMGLFAKIWGKSVKLKLGYPANSGVLRHNMTQLLGQAPVGSQAHHIVGAVSKFGKRSRDKLGKLGIDINSVSNGVFLPGCKGKGVGTIHCGKHTQKYEQLVWDLLKKAKTREQAVNVLGDIRKELLSGIIRLNKR